ncbi:MAG: hypothetical protein WKH64_14215 [Chloroflexia bacterium]
MRSTRAVFGANELERDVQDSVHEAIRVRDDDVEEARLKLESRGRLR